MHNTYYIIHTTKKAYFLSGLILFMLILVATLSAKEAKAATLNSSQSQSYRQNTGVNRGLNTWLTFDGADGTGDKSGQNNNGTTHGGVIKAIGKIGQGLKLDGSTGYIDVINSTLTPSMTVSLWAKSQTADWNAYGWLGSSRVANGFIIHPNIGGKNWAGYFFDQSASFVSIGSYTPADIQNWHLYTISYSAITDTAYMYFDGRPVVSKYPMSLTGRTTTTGQTAYFGSDSLLSGRYGNGSIDDVRTYNRALSASEIKQLYNIGMGGKTNSSMTPEKTMLGINSGLVGYWTFDGADVNGATVYDKSGLGNNGTSLGGITKVAGKLGQAMNFNGGNAYVDLGTSASLNIPGDLTLSAWVNPKSLPINYYANVIISGRNVEGQMPYDLTISTSAICTSFVTTDGWTTKCGGASISLNTWTHIVLKRTGQLLYFYKNGNLVGSDSFTGSVNSAYSGPIIGKGFYGGSYFFNGKIDDVRIYNRALSSTEVKQLYNSSAGSQTNASITPEKTTLGINSGLAGYWTMDGADIAGTNAYDKSGGFATGTITGGPVKTMGKIGQGIKFRESATPGDFIDVGAPSRLELYSNFTMSAWVSPTKNPANDVFILSKDYNTGARGYGFGLHFDRTIYLEANGNIVFGTVGAVIPINSWSLITIVHNGSAWLVYQNGSYVNQSTSFINISPNTLAHWYINGRHFGAGNFQGAAAKIDDVRIYNRPLSSKEVQQLYQMGK